jgi:threonine/homoserine/homoserine lactone efflux protein
MIGTFFLSLLIGLSGATIPGPLFALTVQQALAVGWTAGLWLMIGHMLAEGALVTGLRFGLGRFLQRPLVTRVVGLVGGSVLLYLAWGMLATALQGRLSARGAAAAGMSPFELVGSGFLLTVTNPTWYIWWATAGVALIAARVESQRERTWPVFFTGHILADYLWYILVSTLVAVGGSFLSPAVHRAVILVCGTGVAIIGLYFVLRPLLEKRENTPSGLPDKPDRPDGAD